MKEKLPIVESLLKILGILMAIAWFMLQGEAFTRGNVFQNVKCLDYDDFFNLLDLSVTVKNCGKCPIQLNEVIVTVHEIGPLADKGKFTTTLGKYASYRSYTTSTPIEWPQLIRYNIDPSSVVRPGEEEVLNYQILVPKSKQILQVQTYVERGKAGMVERWLPHFPGMAPDVDEGIGWYADSMVDIREVSHGNR